MGVDRPEPGDRPGWFRAAGRSALNEPERSWTGQLAKPLGADVVAVNSFRSPYAEAPGDEHRRLLAQREEQLGKWIRSAEGAVVEVVGLVREGDPRRVLLDECDAQGDLLVLGRTGLGGGPGFLHLGSVVEYAAHHTPIPLAVIPPNRVGPVDRIVIGVDGSPASLAAVAWLSEVAPALGASVIAVEVEEPYLEWTPPTSPKNWRRDVEHHLVEWTAPVHEAGADVLPIAQRDLHPADGLLGVAAARHGDLLVVGTRGLGGFTGLRAGGVALKVLHRANIPLVLVPER